MSLIISYRNEESDTKFKKLRINVIYSNCYLEDVKPKNT